MEAVVVKSDRHCLVPVVTLKPSSTDGLSYSYSVTYNQWWIEGWATGAAAQGTKGGEHQRGESKNNANLHNEKHVILKQIKLTGNPRPTVRH